MDLQQFKETILDQVPKGTIVYHDCRVYDGKRVVDHNFLDVMVMDRVEFVPKGSKIQEDRDYSTTEDMIQIWYTDGWRFQLGGSKERNPHGLPNDHAARYVRDYNIEDLGKWSFGKLNTSLRFRADGLDEHLHLLEKGD